MKKIISLLIITSQIVLAGGQQGTGGEPENTASNNTYEYIQVCINGGEQDTGEQVDNTTTVCTIVQVQPSTSS